MKKESELNNSLPVLKAAIEATVDGLLVTDKQGKVLCYNQLYVDMWPIPSELLTHASHHAILGYCAGQLRDPERFLRSIEEIYAMLAPEALMSLNFVMGGYLSDVQKSKLWKDLLPCSFGVSGTLLNGDRGRATKRS
ncbi:hypothetical protein [Nitrosospira multiformis]|uniref:hypothetical protein n=1 Tax=Nitrosospira multiformis TaxID=1231 RepID=UPI000AA7DEC1|nr:hypothetical protein [Nitrosospira multiformis]